MLASTIGIPIVVVIAVVTSPASIPLSAKTLPVVLVANLSLSTSGVTVAVVATRMVVVSVGALVTAKPSEVALTLALPGLDITLGALGPCAVTLTPHTPGSEVGEARTALLAVVPSIALLAWADAFRRGQTLAVDGAVDVAKTASAFRRVVVAFGTLVTVVASELREALTLASLLSAVAGVLGGVADTGLAHVIVIPLLASGSVEACKWV